MIEGLTLRKPGKDQAQSGEQHRQTRDQDEGVEQLGSRRSEADSG